MATRVDPLLLVLPTLDAPAQRSVPDDERRFGDAADLFAGDASILSVLQLPHCDLQHVCDVKGMIRMESCSDAPSFASSHIRF